MINYISVVTDVNRMSLTMISVKSLLEEKKKPVNLLYLPASKGAVSHKTAHNLRTFASSKGHKYIGVPNDAVKAILKSILPNHNHRIIVAPTIFHAADEIKKKGHSGIIAHTEPSKAKMIEDGLTKTHGKSLDISIKHLPNEFEDAESVHDVDPSIKRADAKGLLNKESFEIGDYVRLGEVEGEILHIHPKYAIIVSEGKEYRAWIDDIEMSENQPRRNQLYKESFIYKGYQTKNFNRTMSEAFKEISLVEEDQYAILECLKVLDYIAGITDKTIEENFKTVRIQTERLKRYSRKIGVSYLTDSIISTVEEELLKYAILEDVKFTTTDRNMVSRVIAMTAGIESSNMDPTNNINQAANALRTSQLTPQGWEMLGRLLNVATKAGIRWNKDIFSNAIRTSMKLI